MCGIAGIFFKNKKTPSFDDLKQMSKLIKTRGPDDVGFLKKEHIGLVHTRLSIRDLSNAGNCPMISENKRYHLIFNGEIYNWRDLKKQLIELGYQFLSNSDSEVILNGFQAWKEEVIKKLEGMFSFAIWDDIDKKLFLGIDRVGEKPLYYYNDQNKFIFGSNVQTILCYLNSKELNNSMIPVFLSHAYLSKNKTIWKNIKRVLPSSSLMISLNQDLRVKKYWDFPKKPPFQTNYNVAIENVEKLLSDSIKKCLDADVPVGVFLSGGVDSSIVTAIASKFDKKIKAYSLGYKEQSFNELEYADLVGKHLSLDNEQMILKQDDAIECLPHLVEQYGQPFGDASAIPTYFISKLARKDVKVCLSGDGGDELFGGYWRLQSVLYSNIYQNLLPLFFRKHCIPKFSLLFGSLGKRLNALNSLSLNPSHNSYTNSESWFDHLKKVLGTNYNLKINKKLISDYRVGQAKFINDYTLTQKVLYDDIKVQFPYALLTKVDVSSMAASLEVRAPFLDKSLMEYAWCLPDKTKVRFGIRKKILKSLAEKFLPKEVIYRKKMGFGIPLKEWFLTDLGDYGREIFRNSVSEDLGYLKKNVFEKNLLLHKKTKNETTRLWLLLWLEIWFQQNHHHFKIN